MVNKPKVFKRYSHFLSVLMYSIAYWTVSSSEQGTGLTLPVEDHMCTRCYVRSNSNQNTDI